MTALRQITPAVLKESAHLYKPGTAVRWKQEPGRGSTNRRFAGENPPFGASLYYSLAKKADKIGLRVLDIDGSVVRELSRRRRRACTRWSGTRAAPAGVDREAGKGKGKDDFRRSAQPCRPALTASS